MDKRRLSQKDQVLADLKKGKKITPLDALRDYGCFRLAAVIHALRKEEHIINTERVDKDDKNYALYSLEKLAPKS